jgi:hypothetical protein
MTTYEYTIFWTTSVEHDLDMVGPGEVLAQVAPTVRALMPVDEGVSIAVKEVAP